MCVSCMRDNLSGLTEFCNSDYGGDLDARKSTSGFVFTKGGSTLSWNHRSQMWSPCIQPKQST